MLRTLSVYLFTGFSFVKNIVSARVALSFFVSLFSEFIFIFKECGWLNLRTFKIIFTISKVRKLHVCDCFLISFVQKANDKELEMAWKCYMNANDRWKDTEAKIKAMQRIKVWCFIPIHRFLVKCRYLACTLLIRYMCRKAI